MKEAQGSLHRRKNAGQNVVQALKNKRALLEKNPKQNKKALGFAEKKLRNIEKELKKTGERIENETDKVQRNKTKLLHQAEKIKKKLKDAGFQFPGENQETRVDPKALTTESETPESPNAHRHLPMVCLRR